jgi:hypothetical protein
MLVESVDCRVSLPASASVPVLTDQRSTPQLPVSAFGAKTTASDSSSSGSPGCCQVAPRIPAAPVKTAAVVNSSAVGLILLLGMSVLPTRERKPTP